MIYLALSGIDLDIKKSLDIVSAQCPLETSHPSITVGYGVWYPHPAANTKCGTFKEE